MSFGSTINNAGSLGVNATLARKSWQDGNYGSAFSHGIEATKSIGNIIGGELGNGINKASSWAGHKITQAQNFGSFVSSFQQPEHQFLKTA